MRTVRTELAAWGELLKGGMIVAFTADPADVWMEGSYWLALINGPAFPVPESQVCTGSCEPHTLLAHTRPCAACRFTQPIGLKLAGLWLRRSGSSWLRRARVSTSCSRRSGDFTASQPSNA